MESTFTSVFYESTPKAAEARLENLRKTDLYPEIKAYIIKQDGEWRVSRKIRVNLGSEKPGK